MKQRFPLFFLAFIMLIGPAMSQKKVAIVSFYLDREVDFSLMQAFNDNSKDRIKKLMEDPEFDLTPLISDFHDFILADILPSAPFEIIDEAEIISSEDYEALAATVDEKKTALHQPYQGYLPLGEYLEDGYLQVARNHGADGLMMANLTFYVRKNGLKTVIMAQVELDIRSIEGKRAWKYMEFGISPEGITTFSGFIVSNKDEVMPMFTGAVEHLKEKMRGNFAKRATKSTKKL